MSAPLVLSVPVQHFDCDPVTARRRDFSDKIIHRQVSSSLQTVPEKKTLINGSSCLRKLLPDQNGNLVSAESLDGFSPLSSTNSTTHSLQTILDSPSHGGRHWDKESPTRGSSNNKTSPTNLLNHLNEQYRYWDNYPLATGETDDEDEDYTSKEELQSKRIQHTHLTHTRNRPFSYGRVVSESKLYRPNKLRHQHDHEYSCNQSDSNDESNDEFHLLRKSKSYHNTKFKSMSSYAKQLNSSSVDRSPIIPSLHSNRRSYNRHLMPREYLSSLHLSPGCSDTGHSKINHPSSQQGGSSQCNSGLSTSSQENQSNDQMVSESKNSPPNHDSDPPYSMSPLPGRRFLLFRRHFLFVLLLTLSVLLGVCLHPSKFHRIRFSLSIDGFECFLPSPLTTSVSCNRNHINLGSLLAADLLMMGWGKTLNNTQPKDIFNYNNEVAFYSNRGFCKEASLMQISSCIGFHQSDIPQCFVHQDLLTRSFCVQSSDMASVLTDWNSAPFSCSNTHWMSLSDVSLFGSIYHNHKQFAPLLLSWRRVTPSLLLSPCYSPVLAKQRQCHNNSKTVSQLQREVYRLATRHPKLMSLNLKYSYNKRSSPGSKVVLNTSEHEVDNTVRHAEDILRFYQSIDLRLYSVGTSTPYGLMDNSIWFSQCSLNKFDVVHSFTEGIPLTNLDSTSDTEVSKFLEKLSLYWDIQEAPTGSIGRPIVVLNNNSSSSVGRYFHGYEISTLPTWIQSMNDHDEYIIRLFRWTYGLFNPCYPLHHLIKLTFHSGLLYIVVFVSWLHSLGSPGPVTLFHFPRFCVYLIILAYRLLGLYLIGGKLFDSIIPDSYSFDYSDHIVLNLSLGLILCIECVAAERSHKRIGIPGQPLNQDRPSESRFLMFDSDVEDTPDTKSLINESRRLLVNWRWPRIVNFVHCYCLSLLSLLCYSSFFTSLYFHHPSESLMGLVIGILFLYLPFWLLLVTGCVTFEKTFGILRESHFSVPSTA